MILSVKDGFAFLGLMSMVGVNNGLANYLSGNKVKRNATAERKSHTTLTTNLPIFNGKLATHSNFCVFYNTVLYFGSNVTFLLSATN